MIFTCDQVWKLFLVCKWHLDLMLMYNSLIFDLSKAFTFYWVNFLVYGVYFKTTVIFLISYLAAQKPTLGHWQGVRLTNQMFIIALLLFILILTRRSQERTIEARSQGPAKHPVEFEPETFKFRWSTLTHWATIPKTTLHLYFMKFIVSGNIKSRKPIICIWSNYSLSTTVLNLSRKPERTLLKQFCLSFSLQKQFQRIFLTFFNSRWYGCITNFYLIFSHVFNRFKITGSSRLSYTSSMVWVLIVFLHYLFPKQEIRQKAITNDNFHWQFCPPPTGYSH